MYNSWKGTVENFINISLEDWLNSLIKNSSYSISEEQKVSWIDCFKVLQDQFSFLTNKDILKCGLIFEYELPREGGKRPDVILLTGNHVIVFEFKRKKSYTPSDIDQVSEYCRNLRHYHQQSQSIIVTPVLIPTKMERSTHWGNQVLVLNKYDLHKYLDTIQVTKNTIQINDWIHSQYAPLPSIIQAAQTIYQEKELPQIKRAHSVGIPNTINELSKIAKLAKENKERHLILITGVPGAGKTLVGLQFSYEYGANETGIQQAIFLSGNGPLVKVLQYALHSDAFVKPLRNYIEHHAIQKREIPREHILIFDEAQRAWDANKVYRKHKIHKSEPELIISTADTIKDWSIVIGLVGEGQEIHIGEERGLLQWHEAISKSKKNWTIHCPEHIAHFFTSNNKNFINESLNLSTSLRTHIAEDVQSWINAVLEGDSDLAFKLAATIRQQGFSLYITTSLDVAKEYCRDRYLNNLNKRYGLLASSKNKLLPSYGIKNDFESTQKMHVGKWYNDSFLSSESCCSFTHVATEFSCQGLELDLPILCWEADLVRENNEWINKAVTKNAKNSKQLRVNSYRVLLSRGRDGLIVYVPKAHQLRETYTFLQKCGLKILN
ncbi:DNA/RNA helicase domain-containing protein [Bacillus sp. S13(2024)]|uniref:DNA/RNA helicase domain-containing protein n=1 Tax=unclassified Bacillus (in: firmicutes) TaxID=185979 RepID=UPI003D2051B9